MIHFISIYELFSLKFRWICSLNNIKWFNWARFLRKWLNQETQVSHSKSSKLKIFNLGSRNFTAETFYSRHCVQIIDCKQLIGMSVLTIYCANQSKTMSFFDSSFRSGLDAEVFERNEVHKFLNLTNRIMRSCIFLLLAWNKLPTDSCSWLRSRFDFETDSEFDWILDSDGLASILCASSRSSNCLSRIWLSVSYFAT